MITETIWCAGKPYELPVYDDPDIYGWVDCEKQAEPNDQEQSEPDEF